MQHQFGYCQQLGGYPPNCQRIDYVIVKSVSGSTVSLDRPLHYSYNHDWWEDPNDDGSLDVCDYPFCQPGWICHEFQPCACSGTLCISITKVLKNRT